MALRTIAALLGVVVVLLTGAATAAADERDDFIRYGKVREQMLACSLDRTWHHLGSVERRRCKRLRKLYVLWSEYGSAGFHIHCKTRRCPPRPIGEPDPRAPIPRGAVIFR